MLREPRVCVIGAGSSGLAAIKALRDRGLSVECFEASDRVGGLWVFGNRNGRSAAYRSLHINTSRDRMAYADFPMPADYPDFPHHARIARYFERYADEFRLREHIRFETSVVRVERREEGGFCLQLSTGETRECDALLIANGHHWDPLWPDPAPDGAFAGVELHAHSYVDPRPFVDKRVIIVGMGNSAMDIASEVSQVAARAFLSMRRGAHIVPKYVFGRPLDQFINVPRMPLLLRQAIIGAMLRIAVGRPERYGLPRPDHKVLSAHPTISGDILLRLGSGDVVPKPEIRERRGHEVRFSDGTAVEADAIIYCTGYKVTFPFFDPSFLQAKDNDLPLFFRVFRPELPDLMFIGFLQPLGATMPLAEAQARWVASYLRGEYALPAREEMEAHIARERAARLKRYGTSCRHTMQVDFDDYLYDLRRERARGERRARRGTKDRPRSARP